MALGGTLRLPHADGRIDAVWPDADSGEEPPTVEAFEPAPLVADVEAPARADN